MGKLTLELSLSLYLSSVNEGIRQMLKISELAGRIGLSAHTIRFYEKHGLIEASERSDSGYRLYSAADVNRAEFVKTARNKGAIAFG